MYRCLLPSSVTVKMDYEENMDNARYATHDDTPVWTKDWIILCCMKNVTVTVIWKMNCHLPSTMFTHVFYMAFFISHVISTRDAHISQRTEGPRANMGRGLRWHVIWKMHIIAYTSMRFSPYLWELIVFRNHIAWFGIWCNNVILYLRFYYMYLET